jgi:hypothetical protein
MKAQVLPDDHAIVALTADEILQMAAAMDSTYLSDELRQAWRDLAHRACPDLEARLGLLLSRMGP